MLENLDALLLARAQFAFTIAFHIVFPAFTIGLASYLFVLNALWLITKRQVYEQLFDFWKTIFAVAFAMGVVSGIVMSYQFGTNWSVFSDKVGPVIGPLMGYEVLTAFFLEAGFLGVMLFGLKRVGHGLHLFATGMVAIGTLLSATWILAANSWMHTPQGFEVNEVGQFVPLDWWAIIFTPSFPYRLVHMVLAAYLTTALVVGACGAWHLLRAHAPRRSATMFTMAMGMVAVVAPLQILAGDFHGLNTLEHQPAKVMAMEGHFESHPEGRAPLILFGLPDQENKRVDYEISIPGLSSLILRHGWNEPLDGLDTIPDELEPPVAVVFWSFRVMVAMGMAMLLLGLWSAIAWWRGRLTTDRRLLRAAVAMGPAGFLAVLAGWVTTEVGRQPYTVYGHLLTADSMSPVAAPAVATSLVAFVVVYFFVFGAGVFYIFRLMGRLPEEAEEEVLDKGPVRTAGITPGPAQGTQQGETHGH
ncbi:cytochrome ubiquinol oxidase subunit I [Pleomorphomonas sp. NRK KF1]|uniref:cytochrome ubiquinol oxidase subunit I n=1 Tax=Pleomorphomonas sp. NRK KF1 TaxID=2943000 RepID=UPI0020436269|nr:cytochrome ubiquinol oxidase subunit I [Pleomorphomonas sp. NRK KF1]MCM5552350.1 cytochrome ubiquinol oxidase subunit I [Pleomorphomonas sp. NRK KF1]